MRTRARSLPRSVTALLDRFRGCFTAPTFEVFCALVVESAKWLIGRPLAETRW
jgi:hypothetical protein